MSVKQYEVVFLDCVFGAQDLGEVEGDLDVNVSRHRGITSNAFEEKFGFREVEALCVDEFQIRGRNSLPLAHFEEAVEDEDEFLEIGRKSSASDILRTLATCFQIEAPALEHLFWNCSHPENWEAPVWWSL